jgi:hypothetical protein
MQDPLDQPLKPEKEVSIAQQSILAGTISIILFIPLLFLGLLAEYHFLTVLPGLVIIGEIVSQILIHQWKRH